MLDAFPFDAKQNAKTILQVARSKGLTDLDAVIKWLDRNMADHLIKNRVESRATAEKQLARNINPFYDTETFDKNINKYNREINRIRKSDINRVNEEKKQLIKTADKCSSCASGILIPSSELGVKICARPQSFPGGFIKMNSGCGYSELVG